MIYKSECVLMFTAVQYVHICGCPSSVTYPLLSSHLLSRLLLPQGDRHLRVMSGASDADRSWWRELCPCLFTKGSGLSHHHLHLSHAGDDVTHGACYCACVHLMQHNVPPSTRCCTCHHTWRYFIIITIVMKNLHLRPKDLTTSIYVDRYLQ